MKPLPVSLPQDLREYTEAQAKANHESMAAYIRRLIREDRDRKENADAQ